MMARATAILLLLVAALAGGGLTGGCGGRAVVSENTSIMEARARLVKGQEWFVRGCPGEAELFFREAVGAARLTDNQPLLIQAQNNLGAVLTEKGRFLEAAQWLERALNLALSLPEQPGAPQILNNLGALAYQNGQAGQAEDFWNQALKAARTGQGSLVLPLANLARLNLERRDYESTRLFLSQIRSRTLNETEESLILNLEGSLAFQHGLYKEARIKLEQAAALNRKLAQTRGLATNLALLGKVALHQGQGTTAASYLDRAFFLWAGLNDYRQAAEIYGLLEENQRTNGRPGSLAPYQEALRDQEENALVSPACP